MTNIYQFDDTSDWREPYIVVTHGWWHMNVITWHQLRLHPTCVDTVMINSWSQCCYHNKQKKLRIKMFYFHCTTRICINLSHLPVWSVLPIFKVTRSHVCRGGSVGSVHGGHWHVTRSSTWSVAMDNLTNVSGD